MKEFIKKLNLRWSDLFLLVGFLPFTIFLIFSQVYMQSANPDDVMVPLWLSIVCFVIVVGMWSTYLVLENKEHNLPKQYISWIFILLVIVGVTSIAVQPSHFSQDVVVRMVNSGNEAMGYHVGDIVKVELDISVTHYLFFSMGLVSILMFIYIGLFVFPKRFPNLKFLYYFSFAVIAVIVSIVLYGYVAEYKNYINIFRYILGKDTSGASIYDYAIKSYVIHRNAYGMAMMLGIIFAMIGNSIKKHWAFDAFIIFFLINMLFSICKTGILITLLILVIYYIYRFIVSYKKNIKRSRIILICVGSVVVILLGVVALSVFTKGKVLGFIYSSFNTLGGSSTLDSRLYIWDNTYSLLGNGWWLIGRGFGLLNLVLLPMNTVNGDPVFPTHSAYLNLIAEGGPIYLFAHLALIGYVVILVVKHRKANPLLVIALSLGALAFIIYSFIETIHYLAYIFMFPIMIYTNLAETNPESLKPIESKSKTI